SGQSLQRVEKSWPEGPSEDEFGTLPGNNDLVSTATASYSAPAQPSVKRPNATAIGCIVWLASELMFFAGLFAMYFTLRSVAPQLWEEETAKLVVPFALTITIILV